MEDVTGTLLAEGLPGAIIVVLLGAVVALWRQNDRLHNERLSDMREHNTQMTTLFREIDAVLTSAVQAIGGGK